MKHEFYINKASHLKSLKKLTIFGLFCLIVLIVVNFVTYNLTGFIVVNLLLGGAVLFTLIAFYRTIFLLKLPVLIIDDNSIRYFNALWYNKHKWDKFEIAYLNPDGSLISIGLKNGRIFDRFSFDSLSDEDIQKIINTFIVKGKLVNKLKAKSQ